MKYLQPTREPRIALENIRIPGSPIHRAKWFPGYASYFERLPVLEKNDPQLPLKVQLVDTVLKSLNDKLKEVKFPVDPPGDYSRHVLALEEPDYDGENYHARSEMFVATWSAGHIALVHGHQIQETQLYGSYGYSVCSSGMPDDAETKSD